MPRRPRRRLCARSRVAFAPSAQRSPLAASSAPPTPRGAPPPPAAAQFSVNAEDESCPEVALVLCRMHYSCKGGDLREAQAMIEAAGTDAKSVIESRAAEFTMDPSVEGYDEALAAHEAGVAATAAAVAGA